MLSIVVSQMVEIASLVKKAWCPVTMTFSHAGSDALDLGPIRAPKRFPQNGLPR